VDDVGDRGGERREEQRGFEFSRFPILPVSISTRRPSLSPSIVILSIA
jgi:hypothetical protein